MFSNKCNDMFKNIYNLKLSESQIKDIFILYSLNKGLLLKESLRKKYLNNPKNKIQKIDIFSDVINALQTNKDIELFILSLQLISIQPLLNAQQKLQNIISNKIHTRKLNTFENIIWWILNHENMPLLSDNSVKYFQYLSSQIFKIQVKEVKCY